LEVLVADDGSTDDTSARVASFARRHANVRWLPSAVRSGRPAVPRNRALAAAAGEFVAFIDADDLWTARKLEDQVRVMDGHRSLVLVYSILRCFGPGVKILAWPFGLKPMPYFAATDARTLETGNTVALSSVMVRRDVVQALGGFDEDPNLTAVEDYDLWVRMSRSGAIGFVPRVHGFYRVHSSGISHDLAAQRRRAEYLVQKLNIQGYTFRQFKERSFVRSVLWNATDLAITLALNARERIERKLDVDVPVRSGRQSPGPAPSR
jgi:GT2 family glycosyltransferase